MRMMIVLIVVDLVIGLMNVEDLKILKDNQIEEVIDKIVMIVMNEGMKIDKDNHKVDKVLKVEGIIKKK